MGEVIEFPQWPKWAELTRDQKRLQALMAYLDQTDPDWREKINEILSEEK